MPAAWPQLQNRLPRLPSRRVGLHSPLLHSQRYRGVLVVPLQQCSHRKAVQSRNKSALWAASGSAMDESPPQSQGLVWLGRDGVSGYKRCSEFRSLNLAARALCATSAQNLSAVSASREDTKVFLLQAARITAAMPGIDARQLRAAPAFQTGAGTDCLAAQQQGLGRAQRAAQIGTEARAYGTKAAQLNPSRLPLLG